MRVPLPQRSVEVENIPRDVNALSKEQRLALVRTSIITAHPLLIRAAV